MLFISFLPASAPAAEDDTLYYNLIFSQWKDYPASHYNPDDIGKTITPIWFLYLEGTNSETGVDESFFYLLRDDKIPVGENKTYEIDISDGLVSDRGIHYDKVRTLSMTPYMFYRPDEPYYSLSINVDPKKPNVVNYYYCSAMNLNVKTVAAEGAEGFEDVEDLNLVYRVKEIKDGEATEGFMKLRNGQDLAATRAFQDGDRDFLLREQSSNFHRALDGGMLETHQIKGIKYKAYELHASFEDEAMNEYFTLKTEGNDLDGWVVTLDNRKYTKEEVNPEVVVPFETEYIDDPKLRKGKEVIDVKGVDGLNKVVEKTTYVKLPNGQEKILDHNKEITTVKEPVTEIIRRGTKKSHGVQELFNRR